MDVLFTQFRYHPPVHELVYALYVGMGGKRAPDPMEDLTDEQNEQLAADMMKSVQMPDWLLKQMGPNYEVMTEPPTSGRQQLTN